MKFRQHDLAVLSHDPDAVVWRVIEVNGPLIEVVDAALQSKLARVGLRPTSHAVRRAHLKRLTYEQLKTWNSQDYNQD